MKIYHTLKSYTLVNKADISHIVKDITFWRM